MKFIVQNLTKCAPRLGVITEITRLPNFQIETPTIFLYTKGGSIPHVTRDVLKIITEEIQCIQIPVANSKNLADSLHGTTINLAEFIGLPEYFTYVTVQDVGSATPAGHHLINNVPVWTRSGKIYLNPKNYMATIENFKPDMYCILSDGDTNISSSKKRIAKAVEQTVNFASDCLRRHDKSSTLKDTAIIAAVQGGYCLKSRERCIQELLKYNDKFSGFIIGGLHNNGPEIEFLPFQEVQSVTEHTINNLPEDKLRILEGCWDPLNMIKFVQLGVDVFDTSYLNVLIERCAAITFDLNFESMQPQEDTEFEINMRDDRYLEEIRPLVENCKCLACTKYTRSYIQHLVNVQELLGPVLLTIHNLHHYLEFFKIIRKCINTGNLGNLERYIQIQIENHRSKISGENVRNALNLV